MRDVFPKPCRDRSVRVEEDSMFTCQHNLKNDWNDYQKSWELFFIDFFYHESIANWSWQIPHFLLMERYFYRYIIKLAICTTWETTYTHLSVLIKDDGHIIYNRKL